MSTVAIAMSGGVDSSCAALLLQKQRFKVFGVTLRLYTPAGSSLSSFGSCCSMEDVYMAKRAARVLNIPHYTLDMEKEFSQSVMRNFIEQYMSGRTPNPCVICNRVIKFDLLLKKVRGMGADYLATGHYCIKGKKGKTFFLARGKDTAKDQSYFLYNLTQNDLPYLLFPNGPFIKKQMRALARKHNLPNAEKKESQEICFIEGKNYADFLKKNTDIAIKPGPIYDVKGVQIGTHQGFPFYTIGQRKGLNLGSRGPKFVISINPKKNALMVGDKKDVCSKEFIAHQLSWVSGVPSKKNCTIKAQIRYRHAPAQARVEYLPGNKAKVIFSKSQNAVTPGQAVVFYEGNRMLGGGVIEAGT